MSKGKWIKQKDNKCYTGKVPTIDEYRGLLKSIYNHNQPSLLRYTNELNLKRRYNVMVEDLKKSRFRDYKKSSYNFLMKTGLIKRTKKLSPRNPKKVLDFFYTI